MGGTLLGTHVDDELDRLGHYDVDVKNVSTPVLPANANRRYVMFINDSNETVYMAFGEPARLHHGIRLEKNGGKLEFALCWSNLYGGEVNAIHGAGGVKRLLVTEGE